jgi:D-glycero-D-manno-heptose 1,7-bisphosphate phosphatase
MKRPAVFFDRDNTLMVCDEFVGDPARVALVTGAADAVTAARNLGYATVVFSNQSGVARGYFTEASVHAVNQRLDELLKDGNARAVIDRHEFCPFHPDGSIEKYRKDSPLRKPLPGMIHQAADALALDLSRSWVIGDAPRDIEAGKAAGCRTILFTDPSLKKSAAALIERTVEPDYICSTLTEAIDHIARNTESASKDDTPATSPLAGEGGGEGEKVTMQVDVASPEIKKGPGELTPADSTRSSPHPGPLAQGEREQEHAASPTLAKLESLAAEILRELRRGREQPHADFSVSKLMAGVVQVIVLAVLFLAFLNRDGASLQPLLLFALTLQTMTIALLIMSRQR